MATGNSDRKRKGCSDIVFELNEEDLSPVHSPQLENVNEFEPSPKIKKSECESKPNPTSSTQNEADLIKTTPNNGEESSVGGIENEKVKEENCDTNAMDDNVSLCSTITLATDNSQIPCSLDSGMETQKLNSSSVTLTNELDAEIKIEETDDVLSNGNLSTESKVTYLIKRNAMLQAKLSTLTEKLNNCMCSRIEAEGKPLINIQILDADVKKNYKKQIVKFFMGIPKFYVKTAGESYTITIYEKRAKSIGSQELSECEEQSVSERSDTPSRSSSRKKKKKKQKDETDAMFIIDTAPSFFTNHHQSQVRYSSKFSINEEDEEEQNAEEETKRPQNTCFNCEGNHTLRDCPHPKDFKKINIARNKLKEKYTKSVRYHLEEEQKYSHLKPGQISNKLRKALGVESDELPPYIYRMRQLGYPPGWMIDAQIINDQLDLFDINGKSISKDKSTPKDLIDPDKIIEYEGFNIPTSKSMRDYYRKYNCPPYSHNDSKEKFVERLREMCKVQPDNFEVCDMEISTDDPVKPEETSNTNKEIDTSLADLERQKTELLAQLNDSDTNEDSKDNLNASQESVILIDDSKNVTDLNESIISIDDDPTPTTPSVKTIKDSSFGTPIIKSASKFSKLPNPDNFAQNVSPVINFENLPNSTGKYEKMNEVLAKVRLKMKSLGEEKS